MVKRKEKVLVLGSVSSIGKSVLSLLEKKRKNYSSVAGIGKTDFKIYQNVMRILAKEKPTHIINCLGNVGGVHYVSQYAADVISDNMRIINNLYDAVKEVNPEIKIINYLSNCSYPGDANIHCEPDWEKGPVHNTVLSYASTRRMLYAFSKCFRMQHGIKSVNWLVANHYGPFGHKDPQQVHALDGIIIRMIYAQRRNQKTFEIWGSGRPLREWIYTGDLARVLVGSLSINEQVYPVNVAQQNGYSIKEIAEIVAEIIGYKVNLSFNRKYPDGAPIKILDKRNFRKVFPRFKFTPLREGIKETVNYYQSIL